ncbi:MAG: GNAT family N-acetyltransferase [Thermoplasmata archaeon]|nr:GNAT family N-acetyltransferase [Thermoplasmata archaeon]
MTSFDISVCSSSDIDAVSDVMESISEDIHDNDLFCADDRDFILRHIVSEGFVLKAMADGRVVAFLIVRYPHGAEDNLGRDGGLSGNDLDVVFHVESVAVLPEYRGNGLQRELVGIGEQRAVSDGYTEAYATVSPRNSHSLDNMLKLGYEVLREAPKYGSVRLILHKSMGPCSRVRGFACGRAFRDVDW